MCGAKGTREIAFREAAIEVIKRGEDRFIVVGDQSNSAITGGMFNSYGGFDTYGTNTQDMVIQIIRKGDAGYNNALSARQTLGPDWRRLSPKARQAIASSSRLELSGRAGVRARCRSKRSTGAF